MGLFGKKVREIEKSESNVNLAKATSDKASSVIKDLSGKGQYESKKLLDNLMVFSNSSGGTGVSTILSNIAYTMTTKGLKVLLIDLNLTCPIQHCFLGVKTEGIKNDLVSYLLGKSQLSESIINSNEVNLMFAYNRNLVDEIYCNEGLATSNFELLLNKACQYYDVVLVDCPMRIDSMLCNIAFYLADSIYLVWDEGLGSIVNTERIRRNMALSGIDSFTKMRIILNKRTSVHFSDYPITKLNLELVGVLPFDIDIIDNSLKGQIFCQKGSSNAKNAIEFARKIEVITDKVLAIGGYVK